MLNNPRALLFLIFALSGFSGLIYESIWTHYLKLFLGHAAYAQTLVLAIFMGGMALGAWLCGARSTRWKNLLLGYAVIEGVIGIAAWVFHPLFDGYVQLAYVTLLPRIAQPELVTLFKWCSASLLILPQSILLGMTFPLMSGAIIRRFPGQPGATVSMLYFTNSIGAAIGVVISGFVLIEAVGLPGTLRVAGTLNIALALVVWRLARTTAVEHAFVIATSSRPEYTDRRWLYFFLGIAAFTGAASFIYEIVWLRMLSLVLGSSTHAFELMLSAFILGLALGGLWIKRRIDGIAHPVRFLAWVQILMGVLAASTLFLYHQSFDVMAWLVNTLAKDDAGYALFNISSHAIAVAIMVPATFLAGMTLPLLTCLLMKQGHGERSIGSVYAANTLGAIAGVFFATHLGMPLLGLKGLLITGAALDIVLGVALLWLFRDVAARRTPMIATAIGIGMIAFTLVLGPLDLSRLSSGVYRTGRIGPAEHVVLYHKDGKTASIDLVQSKNTPEQRMVSIMTNGKPDAMLNMVNNGPSAPDESTMIMLGTLPAALHPAARTAAVIGMGSGLSTHTLLAAGQFQEVDTIEIERAVIEAANSFRPRVELAFSSPQSHIYIDDAKTFFSTHNKRYDIILSEPSNPWVSGVAGLFTEEFYALSKRHLAPRGLLVQWLQTYELDEPLVASVMKSLSRHFDDYVIYAPNDVDTIIIARADGPIDSPAVEVLARPAMRAELARIGVRNAQDLELRRIGDRQALAPLYESYAIAANSDYYPVLDLGATRTRFVRANAAGLISFRNASVPALEILSRPAPPRLASGATPYFGYQRTHFVNMALALHDYLTRDDADALRSLDPTFAQRATFVKAAFIECRPIAPDEPWLDHTAAVFNLMMPQLTPDEMQGVWARVDHAPCAATLPPQQTQWLQVWKSVSLRDPAAMVQHAQTLLQEPASSQGPVHIEYLLLCGLLGEIAQHNNAAAQRLWAQHAPRLYKTRKPALVARLLAAHAYGSQPIPYIP